MPQAGRKVPFSGKKKKEQMKAKRTRKLPFGVEGDESNPSESESVSGVQRINDMGNPGGRNTRYALVFQQQSKEQLENAKKATMVPFEFAGENSLHLDEDSLVLNMPRRPSWANTWSKQALDAQENKYFREYTKNLMTANPDLSYFEMNLETWRQLWRVLEMSDIILLIADIRYPIVHIPLSLLKYVEDLGKRFIIVLNKVDLVEPELAAQWIQYLEAKNPSVKVVPFASYAGCKVVGKRRRGKMRSPLHSCLALLSAITKIAEEDKLKIDFSAWERKIREDCKEQGEEFELEVDEIVDHDEVRLSSGLTEGFLTLGMVGHPNVGKSSLLNALMGRKVVSVSRTPGHTKHFQTIFLTKHIRLCDCPGLVFPTTHPRELQVISGSFPVAQLRTPLSAVQYVAERIHVERILRLPKIDTDVPQWSAFEIAESWAEKRGFLTAKTGRPDVNRAANHILRMALDGRTLCVAFRPPRDKVCPPNPAVVNKIKEMRGIKMDPLVSDEEDQTDGESETSGGATDADDDGTAEDEDQVPRVSNKFAMLMTE